MRSQIFSTGTSIGLSVLLAGLLLATANPERTAAPTTSFEMRTKATEPRLTKETKSRHHPTTIVLPSPPPPPSSNNAEEVTKPSHVTMKPLAVIKRGPIPQITPLQKHVKKPAPIVSTKPLPPRRKMPNDNDSIPKTAVIPTPTVKNVLQESNSKKPLAIVRPNEDAELAAEGRVLLRMLEHGRGPAIEIAWPKRARDQEKLYQIFKNCMGMRLALRDGEDRLYVLNSRPGHTWQVDFDRFSGFARQPTGRLAQTERRDIANIAKHHRLSRRDSVFRIFPRRIDAQLLGGLRQLVGTGYKKADNIHAKYGFFANDITIMDIQVDGQAITGRVMLESPAKFNCRIG